MVTQQIRHNELLIQEAESDWQIVQTLQQQSTCGHCRGPHPTVTCVGLTVGGKRLAESKFVLDVSLIISIPVVQRLYVEGVVETILKHYA